MKYFYSDGQSQFGPFSKEELYSKGITKETLVWYEGLTEWVKAGESDELKDFFPKIPTPPPLPKSITPPPVTKQETQTPSTSIDKETTARSSSFESVKQESVEPTEKTIKKADNISIPKRNLPEPKSEKKSSKKPIIVVSIILICVAILAVIIGVAKEQQKSYDQQKSYYQQIEGERNYPAVYLSIEDYWLENSHTLRGTIKNNSTYTTYKEVELTLTFFDQYGAAIPVSSGSTYYVEGNIKPHSNVPFKVKIKSLPILKTALKNGDINVSISGAVPSN